MNTELLKLLLETYVELNKISASPGDKSHRLWKCIEFIERTIKQIIKDDKLSEENRFLRNEVRNLGK